MTVDGERRMTSLCDKSKPTRNNACVLADDYRGPQGWVDGSFNHNLRVTLKSSTEDEDELSRCRAENLLERKDKLSIEA